MNIGGDGMSYIVPKEKPRCFNCPFRTLDYCGLLTEHDCVTVNVNEMSVSEYCPLIEIHTPHGRLIAEKTITEIRYHDADGYHIVNGEQLCELEIDAPTVIEAEGKSMSITHD